MWTQPSSEPQTRKAPSWEKVARICVLRLWCPLYLVRRLKPAQAAQQPQLEHTSRSGAVLGEQGSNLHAAGMLPIMIDHQAEASSLPAAPRDLVPRALCLNPRPDSHLSNLLKAVQQYRSASGNWVRRPHVDEPGMGEGESVGRLAFVQAHAGVVGGDEELRGVLRQELHPCDLPAPGRVASPVLHVCASTLSFRRAQLASRSLDAQACAEALWKPCLMAQRHGAGGPHCIGSGGLAWAASSEGQQRMILGLMLEVSIHNWSCGSSPSGRPHNC